MTAHAELGTLAKFRSFKCSAALQGQQGKTLQRQLKAAMKSYLMAIAA